MKNNINNNKAQEESKNKLSLSDGEIEWLEEQISTYYKKNSSKLDKRFIINFEVGIVKLDNIRKDWLFTSKNNYNKLSLIIDTEFEVFTRDISIHNSNSKRERKINKIKRIINEFEEETELKYLKNIQFVYYLSDEELVELESELFIQINEYQSSSINEEKDYLIDEIEKLEDSICFKLQNENHREYNTFDLLIKSLEDIKTIYKNKITYNLYIEKNLNKIYDYKSEEQNKELESEFFDDLYSEDIIVY